MPTLAGFNGASLVPNFADEVRQDIAGFKEQRKADKAQRDLENDLRIALGGQPAEEKQGGPLGFLGQVAPGMAKAINQLRGNPDPEATRQFRDEVGKGVSLAKEMREIPTFAGRQRRLAEEVGRASASGGDVSRLVELSNMSEPQLDLELEKMGVVGQNALKAVPDVAQGDIFRVLSNPTRRDATTRILANAPQQGRLLLQGRQNQLAQDEARRKEALAQRQRAAQAAAAARAPKTDLAKTITAIQSDAANGLIQPEIAQQLITNARTEATGASSKTELAQTLGSIASDARAGLISPDTAELMAAKATAEATAIEQPDLTFEQQKELRREGRPITNVSVSGDQKGAEALSKLTAGKFVEAQEAGATAATNLAQNEILRQSLSSPDLFTGTGGNVVQTFKGIAQSLGLPVQGVADGEIVQTVGQLVALNLTEKLSGPISDSDRKFLTNIPPNLTKSPEANRRLLLLSDLMDEQTVAVAEAWRNNLADGVVSADAFNAVAQVEKQFAPRIKGHIKELRAEAAQAKPRSLGAGISIDKMTLPQLRRLKPEEMTTEQLDQAVKRLDDLTRVPDDQ